MQIAGVIGSCRCRTSNCSRSSARRIRRYARGERTMFGSDPFAGTITERPTGSTFGGGSPCRPTRGWSARVNCPGGSLPMISRTSWPRPSSAAAWSSACSTTAPQNDQENGTTIPIFTRDTNDRPLGWADRFGAATRRSSTPQEVFARPERPRLRVTVLRRNSRAPRRHPPRHVHHGRRPGTSRLQHPRARAPAGQEDGQPGRPDRLPPVLRRRGGQRRQRHHVLRVPGLRRGRAGAGMVHTVGWRVGSEDALAFWAEAARCETRSSRATRPGSPSRTPRASATASPSRPPRTLR